MKRSEVPWTICYYFKHQSVPIIAYSYASPIAPHIFNYKRVLQDLIIDDLKAIHSDCSCRNYPFKYKDRPDLDSNGSWN